jgi:hypothetical protein
MRIPLEEHGSVGCIKKNQSIRRIDTTETDPNPAKESLAGRAPLSAPRPVGVALAEPELPDVLAVVDFPVIAAEELLALSELGTAPDKDEGEPVAKEPGAYCTANEVIASVMVAVSEGLAYTQVAWPSVPSAQS